MMRGVDFLAFALIGAFLVTIVTGFGKPTPVSKPPELSVYIIRTSRIHTIEGKKMWVLEYTVNGELHTPAFDSREAMDEYRDYLGTIGRVYQRETGEE
jgi:hypothetical protein